MARITYVRSEPSPRSLGKVANFTGLRPSLERYAQDDARLTALMLQAELNLREMQRLGLRIDDAALARHSNEP